MVQCLLVALVGGWLMAQQPQPARSQVQLGNEASPMVTQTELPPPVAAGASAAKPAPSAPAHPTAKAPAPPHSLSNHDKLWNEQTSDKKSTAQFVKPRQTVSEKKAPESKKGRETAPPLEGGKQSTGGRVAAFWIILPGK